MADTEVLPLAAETLKALESVTTARFDRLKMSGEDSAIV